MTIKLHCNNCGTNGSTEDMFSHISLVCPNCGEQIQ